MGWLSGPSAGDDRYIIVEANYNNKIIDLNALAGNDTLDLRGENRTSGYRSGLFENFSLTDATDDVGQYLLVAGYIGASFVTFKAREFETIKFVDYTYEVVLNDTVSPTVELSSNVAKLAAGETAKITFTLSEDSTDFTVADIYYSGGELSNFQGSGSSYSVNFTKNLSGITEGLISVDNNKFSDAAGNFNNDAADANNTVTIELNGIAIQNAVGDETLVGSSGIDTLVYDGNVAEFVIDGSGSQIQITHGAEVDTISGIERLQFGDSYLALDVDGANSAGGIYRTYQAAFDRTPDSGGFGYWIDRADNGASAVQMAEEFVWSAEFQSVYNVTTQDSYLTGNNIVSVVDGFYRNVLGRAPDQGGLDFYSGVIISNERTVGRVLAEIADSAENRSNLLPDIQNGMVYDLWVG